MTGLHVATRRENIKILLMTWHSFEFGLVLILGGWWVYPVMSVKHGNNFNNVSYPSFPCCFLFLPQHALSIYIFGVFYRLSLFVYFRGCSSVRKLAALFYETKLLKKDCFKSLGVRLGLKPFWWSKIETDFWGVKAMFNWSICFCFFIRCTRFRRVASLFFKDTLSFSDFAILSYRRSLLQRFLLLDNSPQLRNDMETIKGDGVCDSEVEELVATVESKVCLWDT